MRGGYEEKHAKGGEMAGAERGPVMSGMMGSAWHSIATMTMRVQSAMGTRGPHVQTRGEEPLR